MDLWNIVTGAEEIICCPYSGRLCQQVWLTFALTGKGHLKHGLHGARGPCVALETFPKMQRTILRALLESSKGDARASPVQNEEPDVENAR